MDLKVPDLSQAFSRIKSSDIWHAIERDFSCSDRISIFGNGGNLAVADHAAVDISRLTNKLGICPGSGILASSLINDKGHDEWLRKWVEISSRGLSPETVSNSMFIGISSSGKSENVVSALNHAVSMGGKAWMISAKPLKTSQEVRFSSYILEIDEYHTAEVLTLLMTYQLIHSAGFSCPSIESAIADESLRLDFK